MGSLTKRSLLVLCVGLAHTCFAQSQRQCYYPNGDAIPADRACDSDAEHSACCGAPPFGVACISNGLCKSLDGTLSRGSCTDPTFMAPECPKFCYAPMDLGVPLKFCSRSTEADTYCCKGAADDCCDSNNVARLTLGVSPPFTWAVWVGSSSGSYTIATPLPSTSPSSSSTTSTSQTSTTSAAGNSNSNSNSTPPTETASVKTQPSGPNESSNPNESSSSSESSPGLSTGAQAGIGVGAAVGAVLMCAIAFIFWRLRSKNKRLEEALNHRQSQWPVEAPARHMYDTPKELPPSGHMAYELHDSTKQYAELPGRN
ncbi:hypothetical protein C8A00DRAFT_12915 [Chaetomidium leptoderma]|uniref:Mid2 domain-containing protein n=1 Tax=Chaetomidium leptoderma TaxID=669021 RepID=A0AAN6VQU5_9PEZI|nr:hypothetical protein C8A00DRAFT_12915 [Chaetomidium leptoderma]